MDSRVLCVGEPGGGGGIGWDRLGWDGIGLG